VESLAEAFMTPLGGSFRDNTIIQRARRSRGRAALRLG
jgi:hypothetical protein